MKSKTNCLLGLLALSASLALAQNVLAQDQAPATASPPTTTAPAAHHRMADPQQQLARLTKQLGLSADQASKIGTILQTRQQQFEAVHSDTTLKPADRKEKMRSAMQTSSDQINAVLTDTQKAQYAQLKEKMEEKAEQRREK